MVCTAPEKKRLAEAMVCIEKAEYRVVEQWLGKERRAVERNGRGLVLERAAA